MEDIKKSVEILETIELQILGGLHKIKNGNFSEGEKDIEKVSRKSKATCKSIKIKLTIMEKEIKKIKEENRKLVEETKMYKNIKTEMTKLQKEKTKIQEELNQSQNFLSSYFTDSLDKTDSEEEKDAENSQELFEPPVSKKLKSD